MTVAREDITIDGRPVRLWQGGTGRPLLLLHGGWGGAEMHWAPVWNALAAECRVLAPDLPGVAHESEWAPRSLEQATEWIDRVLDAAGVPAAVVVGNSFGAALASRFASRRPHRCLGLVLVDGGPAPSLPRGLGRRPRVRRVMTSIMRRTAWTPATLERAFADPSRAPAELREVLAQREQPRLAVMTRILCAGDPPADPPRVRALVIWGAEDRLPGGTRRQAQRLVRSLPDARLTVIRDAGHLPQVEQPDQFVRAVLGFASQRPPM